jgi:hypothetical protein
MERPLRAAPRGCFGTKRTLRRRAAQSGASIEKQKPAWGLAALLAEPAA